MKKRIRSLIQHVVEPSNLMFFVEMVIAGMLLGFLLLKLK
jgi:hypothetical protein